MVDTYVSRTRDRTDGERSADAGGDALNGVVAASAVFRALRDDRLPTTGDSLAGCRSPEGHIYV